MRVGKKVKNGTSAGKTKPCFVRLEKVHGSVGSRSTTRSVIKVVKEEKMQKKLVGPLKKRPVVSSSVTPVHISKNSMANDIDTTIASGRSRRAPKPNPKYSNDDIVTPKYKLQDDGEGRHQSRNNGQFFEDSSDLDDFYNKDDSDVAEDFSAEDEIFEIEDSEDLDFEEPKSPPRRKPGRPRRVPTPVSTDSAKIISRAPVRSQPRQFHTEQLPNKGISSIASTSTPSQNSMIKMKTATPISTPAELCKKRKLNQTDFEKERENIIARNKRLNIALYDSNNDKPITIKSDRPAIGPQLKIKTQATIKRPYPTELSSKSMNISASQPKKIISLSPDSPKTPIMLTQQSSSLRKLPSSSTTSKLSLSSEKDTSPKTIIKPLLTKVVPSTTITKPQFQKGTLKVTPPASSSKFLSKISLSTASGWQREKFSTREKITSKDEVEAMPTFTIVNINDIINKKGDALVHKAQKIDDNLKQNTMETSNNKSLTPPNLKSTPTSPVFSAAINKNRRKTVHSTILSEKIEPTKLKNPMQRNQLPTSMVDKKPIQKILNHTLSNRSKLANKPAPRILNSVVGKKTLPVQPMISKCKDPDDPDSLDDGFSTADDNETQHTSPANSNSIIKKGSSINNSLNSSKENKINNKSAIGQINRSLPRKLPPERVVVSRQGNKLIKKITCFETWYVINVPEDKPPKIVRNSLDMPLINLANNLDLIKLPSALWSYKVNLHELSQQILLKNNFTPFTGDISEQCIKEEDRSKYQPSSVMFRRVTQARPKARLPYDRAIVFKNGTFLMNMDGKNVRLLGAPTNISSLKDIGVLLDLIDELTLQNPFVEQTSTL